MVGMARCAVRAASSGAIERGETLYRGIPRALRAVTAQRAVPTMIISGIETADAPPTPQWTRR